MTFNAEILIGVMWIVALSQVFGQDKIASTPSTADSGVYMRFANLLPISSKPLTVNRGGALFVDGAKPGFFMPYQPLSKRGARSFEVSSGGRGIGDFKIGRNIKAGFFTAVALVTDAGPSVVCFRDDPPLPAPEDNETPPPPAKRFKGYFGGFDFPYRVEVVGIGTWNVAGKGEIVDIPVSGDQPPEVRLRYISRDGDDVDLYFPLDARAHRNSAFVSQRGLKRPRVRCYADNTLPAEESVASATPSPVENE